MKIQKVFFVIAGNQNSGTTVSGFNLRQHPKISTIEEKEVHFFDDESNFESSNVDYKSYHKNFRPSSQWLVGESTSIYMYWSESIRRIFYYSLDIKFIALLRDSIERAYFYWNMERHRGYDDIYFEGGVCQEVNLSRDALSLQHRACSYIGRGFYIEQLRKIFRFFSKKENSCYKAQCV